MVPANHARTGEFQQRLILLFVKTIEQQRELLVAGIVNEQQPKFGPRKKNGLAYLVGRDSWSDMSTFSEKILSTLPKKLSLLSAKFSPIFENLGPSYELELKPLLEEMATTFGQTLEEFEALRDEMRGAVDTTLSLSTPYRGFEYLEETVDSLKMLVYRIRQVKYLYEFAYHYYDLSYKQRLLSNNLLHLSRESIMNASRVVKHRELHYRTSTDRLVAWRPSNPTSYDFGYLWSVHRLFHYWRDHHVRGDNSFLTLHSPPPLPPFRLQ